MSLLNDQVVKMALRGHKARIENLDKLFVLVSSVKDHRIIE